MSDKRFLPHNQIYFQIPSLIRALPEHFSTDLIVRLYDVKSNVGRKLTIRDLCLLRNICLRSQISS